MGKSIESLQQFETSEGLKPLYLGALADFEFYNHIFDLYK